ncbi:MAG: DUF1501 domain-containing protein [Planctomycetaceae bacterium]|nr:DUF1501 domain-containing protein [Planctomycetaceae bacterium]
MSDSSFILRPSSFQVNRRQLLQSTSSGFGYLAFAAMAQEQAARAAATENTNPLSPKKPHFPAKAKRVIFLCMEGAPSHVDTFDYKPKLTADDGKAAPARRGVFGGGKLMGSPFKFEKRGDSGLWISELFPEVSKHADKLCLLNGMHTDLPNHPQAFIQMHCGIFQSPRPSFGAWVLYGLGTENANLPGFITLSPPQNNGGPVNYGASFLPAMYQGTKIGRSGFGPGGGGPGGGQQVSNLKNPKLTLNAQREQLDFVQSLNQNALEAVGTNPEIEGLISSYELAFRMQGELPKLLDTSNETAATLKLYGIEGGAGGGRPGPGGFGPRGGGAGGFGQQCLLARRLVEAGVRFVEVTMPGWDHHRNLKDALTNSCTAIDKPIAGLLADLKQKDMLKDTLVIWGGEFGRTPSGQGDGRDHNAKGYTMWMAGGGVKGGFAHGKTDDYGFEAVEGKTHVHDWHATVLHLLGFDHEKLVYKHAGREMRLTDTKGNVVKEIVA